MHLPVTAARRVTVVAAARRGRDSDDIISGRQSGGGTSRTVKGFKKTSDAKSSRFAETRLPGSDGSPPQQSSSLPTPPPPLSPSALSMGPEALASAERPAGSPSPSPSLVDKEDSEREFEERLRQVKRAAEQRKAEEAARRVGPIDYDAPPPPLFPKAEGGREGDGGPLQGMAEKVGIGLAAAVFAALFAFGDILPSPSPSPSPQQQAAPPSSVGGSSSFQPAIPDRLRLQLERQAGEFEARLSASPDDSDALESLAVTLVELGQLEKAEPLLAALTQLTPSNVEAYRLLGEVRFSLGDNQASAEAYRQALKVAGVDSIELLQGLSSALIADNQPQQAVAELIAARDRLPPSLSLTAPSTSNEREGEGEVGDGDERREGVDPVQLELLLGKAYLTWGRVADAAAVYDGIIAARPGDFRGYLGKGIFLTEQQGGRKGDADRMFLQARFLAPDNAKALVDRLAGRATN